MRSSCLGVSKRDALCCDATKIYCFPCSVHQLEQRVQSNVITELFSVSFGDEHQNLINMKSMKIVIQLGQSFLFYGLQTFLGFIQCQDSE